MSTFTVSSDTSAAPTTPPTSLSNTSAPSLPLSALPVYCLPAKTLHIQHTVIHQTCPHEDEELRLAMRGATILVGALITTWLLVEAMNDTFIFFTVVALLWFVFGGYQSSGAKQLAATVIPEPIRVPPTAQNSSEKVSTWLMKLSAISTITTEPDLAQSSVHALRVFQSGDLDVKESKYKAMESVFITNIRDIEQTFLELCALIGLFDSAEDHLDILTWMDNLVRLSESELSLDRPNSVNDSFDNNDVDGEVGELEQPSLRSYLEFSLSQIITAKGVPAQLKQKLVTLQKQHGELVFNDGNPNRPFFLRDYFNNKDPIYDDHISDAISGHPTNPGRSIIQDMRDIDFMFNTLEHRLPAAFYDQVAHHTQTYWYRYRCWISGANICRDALVLYWHNLHSPAGGKLSILDVMEFDKGRVKRHRRACPLEMRHRCEPQSPYRAYLTDEEELIINAGCVDYSLLFRDEGVQCELLKQLEMSPDNIKLPGQNLIPAWLDGMTEEKQLDPNAFDICDCGVKAFECTFAYRNETEPGHDPTTSHHLDPEFHLLFLDQEYVALRWAMKLSGDETTNEKRVPRCQTILQNCKLHETVSNNIFVMVDTSFEDINARISAPDGFLPAPGLLKLSKFPPGYKTQPGFLTIPYENLAPRCVHGHLSHGSYANCMKCWDDVTRNMLYHTMMQHDQQSSVTKPRMACNNNGVLCGYSTDSPAPTFTCNPPPVQENAKFRFSDILAEPALPWY